MGIRFAKYRLTQLFYKLGIRTQSYNSGVTFASYVDNWCRGNSLASDLSAGHEWRVASVGVASVGLLSANSFVNRKFGSHGTEEMGCGLFTLLYG